MARAAKTQFWAEGDIGYVKLFSKKRGEIIVRVDAHRLDELRTRGWFVSGTGVYAVDAYGRYMHKILFPAEEGLVRDHINGDGFDNRAANIRIVTQRENGYNRKSRKFKHGVNKLNTGKYAAALRLGCYDTEDEAHEVWKRAYVHHFGEQLDCIDA